ncbi:uncharacterized protein LOC135491429 [Lineus longissimus]|uniref:uncharacterized protein LOC135491429 n=1 Tax=Lineus longissimus TaxID=88925 RepID=UPI00315C889E
MAGLDDDDSLIDISEEELEPFLGSNVYVTIDDDVEVHDHVQSTEEQDGEHQQEDVDEDLTSKPPLPSEFIAFDEIVTRYYLTPYLLYLENDQRVLNDKAVNLRESDRQRLASDKLTSAEISSLIQDVVQYLNEEGDPLFKGGKLSMCGSVAEGTKVSSCDEFDYQYLITLDNYKAYRKPLLRTKPRAANQESMAFYKLTLPSAVDDGEGAHEGEVELVPKEVHERFRQDVCKAIINLKLPYQHYLGKAGPAVKIALWEKNAVQQKVIKIDLTVGIKADPSKLFTTEELTPLTRDLPWGLTFKSHFVCAHDYWKICYVETEQELMKRVCHDDMHKLTCYRAIKCLRDNVDIKDPYGDGILPSYPIKMTFLDIALEACKDNTEWDMYDLGKYTIKILREVEARGQGHRLTSPFVSGDDVMAEADRSYLESRRILKELKRIEAVYFDQQSLLLPFLLFFSFLSYLLTVVYYFTNILRYSVDPDDVMCCFLFPNSVLIFAIQLELGITVLAMGKGLRTVHPLHRIYPHIVLMKGVFFSLCILLIFVFLFSGAIPGCTNVASLEGTLTNKLTCIDKGPFVSFLGALLVMIPLLPALIVATSISLNAIFSLANGKNLLLFDHFLTFPPFNWKWRAPDGELYEFLPEISGKEGLTGFSRLRALLVAVLSPLTTALTIATTCFLMFENDVSNFGWLLTACLVNILLVGVTVVLLSHQVFDSVDMKHYLGGVWLMRAKAVFRFPGWYFFPYQFCQDWKPLRDDLKTD